MDLRQPYLFDLSSDTTKFRLIGDDELLEGLVKLKASLEILKLNFLQRLKDIQFRSHAINFSSDLSEILVELNLQLISDLVVPILESCVYFLEL